MTRIRVNVYDLTSLNRILRCIRVGVYHTSVVINEEHEFYYGFADFGRTGVDSPERLNRLPAVMNGTFYTTVEMGSSSLPARECEQIARTMARSEPWLSDHYNVIYYNCNRFSLELCKALLGVNNVGSFPAWVTRFEYIAKYVFSMSLGYTAYGNSYTLAAFGRPPAPEIQAGEEPADLEAAAVDLEAVAPEGGEPAAEECVV
jgi:hypothetical protein